MSSIDLAYSVISTNILQSSTTVRHRLQHDPKGHQQVCPVAGTVVAAAVLTTLRHPWSASRVTSMPRPPVHHARARRSQWRAATPGTERAGFLGFRTSAWGPMHSSSRHGRASSGIAAPYMAGLRSTLVTAVSASCIQSSQAQLPGGKRQSCHLILSHSCRAAGQTIPGGGCGGGLGFGSTTEYTCSLCPGRYDCSMQKEQPTIP